MKLGNINTAQMTAARIAGFTLLFGFFLAVFGQFYLSSGLFFANDAVKTSAAILAHETRFRIYVVCNLLYVMDLLVLLTALYITLKPVNHGLAIAAAIMRFVYALLWISIVLNMFGALRLLGDAPYLKVIETDHLQALARVYLRNSYDDYYVGLPFFALASTFCAWLWLKSGYIPRALAIFGLAASAWGVFCGFVFLVFPHFNEIVNDWLFDTPLGLFEIALGLWLLIRGLPRSA